MKLNSNNEYLVLILKFGAILVTLAIFFKCIDVFQRFRNNDITVHQMVQEHMHKKETNDMDKFLQTDRKSYRDTMCKLDESRVKNFQNFDVKKSTTLDAFHKFVQDPLNSICRERQRFGGHYNEECKFTDGAKFVCMDNILVDIEKNDCLIYSFGIAEDWTFEDIMSDLGCEVHAYDPTVDYPRKRGENIHFEKCGVAAKEDKEKLYLPLDVIIAKNGHTERRISYLKIDIEGAEIEGLPSWLKSGALDNIQQIGMEFHLSEDLKLTRRFFETLKYLYFVGSYRLMSYEANGCAKNAAYMKNIDYYVLAEIVLKKIDNNYPCADKNLTYV